MGVRRSLFLLVAVVCAAHAQTDTTPAPATTPAATVPTTPAPATTPAATVPTTPATAAPTTAAATAPTTTPAPTAVATTTVASSFLGSFFRAPLHAARGFVNNGLAIKSGALNFSMSAANQLTNGVLDAKQTLVNTKLGVASSATQFGTQAAANGVDMYTGLVAPIPLFGSFASLGSRMFGAGASMVNAGVQSGLAAAHSISNAKTNAIKSAVSSGTGMIQSVGNMAIDTKKSLLNGGINMGEGAVGMLDSAVLSGTNALHSGLQTVNGYVDSARQSADAIAAQASSGLQG